MLDTAAAEFTARAAAYCPRIAALYAALKGLNQISVDHLEAAAALVRYSIQPGTRYSGRPTATRASQRFKPRSTPPAAMAAAAPSSTVSSPAISALPG